MDIFRNIANLVIVSAISMVSTMPSPLYASDWQTYAVPTIIDVSFLPDRVVIQLSTAVGTCPANSWINWHSKGSDVASKSANSQGILATLLSAKLANHPVQMYGSNAGCTVDYISLQ